MGNPTGGLRLVQAGFRVNGTVINQTTYFRQTLFGAYAWAVKRARPRVDHTFVPIRVVLLGTDYGVRNVEVSNKPSGEAGQGNYTSILHWGDLADEVYRLNLVDRRLRLYGPATAGAPFTLEVQ
jgi:hypothetical protein